MDKFVDIRLMIISNCILTTDQLMVKKQNDDNIDNDDVIDVISWEMKICHHNFHFYLITFVLLRQCLTINSDCHFSFTSLPWPRTLHEACVHVLVVRKLAANCRHNTWRDNASFVGSQTTVNPWRKQPVCTQAICPAHWQLT